MALTIIAIAVLLLAGTVGVAATRPDTFRVQRSLRLKAPPERVFALINDFHAWSRWSPWEHRDPSMQRRFEGAASGLGAVYGWSGNGKAGAGRMEITASQPHSQVVIRLDFLKPFEAHNTAEFTLERDGDTTLVTWAMHGPSPLMARVVQLFMSMDRMVGKDFETGLANLGSAARA